MVDAYGRWYVEPDYNRYPKDKWCLFDYLANKIINDCYRPRTNLTNLISLMILHYESYIEDSETKSYCDTNSELEELTDIADDILVYVRDSGGYREFDYEP